MDLHGALALSQVTVWNKLWWLEANTNLETSWAPVNELNGSLGLDACDGCVDFLSDDITAVKQASCHILSVAGIALDHLVVWLEARVGDLSDRVGLVGSFSSGDDWSIRDQWEMDTWVWDQVGLELVKIDVERTIESEGSSDGGNDLSDESVEVLEVWTFDVEGTTADVVDGLVVDHEGTVGLLQSGVGSQDGVVWLDDGGGDLWGWVDGEFELALLSVVNRETLHEEGTETGTSSTTEGVEDEETLETGAVVGNAADSVKDLVDKLLSDGVMTTGI